MSLGAEVETAVDVLKRFAQQARDRHAAASRQEPMADAMARLNMELSDVEAILAEIRRIRTEVARQMAARAFVSPWI